MITEQEEKAYRCRHHDFDAMTVKETADKMGISEMAVYRLIWSLKKKAPQLFPILTKRQAEIYDLWLSEGGDTTTVASRLSLSNKTVEEIIAVVKKKLGVKFPDHRNMMQYTPKLDDQIVMKF